MAANQVDDGDALDAALRALLENHTEVVLAALGPDGYRRAMPASVEVLGHQSIPVADRRATMVDVAVPADRLKVVEIWERAREARVAFGTIRTLSDPDRPMTLTIVDAHHRHGVWLAVLTNSEAAVQTTKPVRPDALAISARPRSASVTKNMTAVITGIDANTTKMFGWDPEHMVGKRSTEFIHPDDHERAIDNWMAMLSDKGTQRVRVRHQCRYGGWLWIEMENVCHDADDPDAIIIETRISDISDEMAAHEALRHSEALIRRLTDSLPTGIAQVDHSGRVVFANRRLGTILDVADAESIDDLFAPLSDADAHAARVAFETAMDLGEDRELEIEVPSERSGAARRCALNIVAVAGNEGETSTLICINDITESAQLREHLREQATFDVLTGCHNRGSVLEALDAALAASPATGTAVLFIDLDDFKPVNDRLGHAAGDELLVHVARRLRAVSRADDLVGRFGGDEFLLVCRDLDDVDVQALAIAERVHFALAHPVSLTSGSVEISASIGVAIAGPGATGDSLVSAADRAMYDAKRRRCGPVLATQPTAGKGRHRAQD